MRSEVWRPAAAARNRSSREARDPVRQALRPGCEELAVTDPDVRRSESRGGQSETKARPREPKTATVERREACVPRHGTQGASLGAWRAALRARPRVLRRAPQRLSALRPPLKGVSEAKRQSPDATMRARE